MASAARSLRSMRSIVLFAAAACCAASAARAAASVLRSSPNPAAWYRATPRATPRVWPLGSRAGLVEPFIVGGQDAELSQFPYQVSVQLTSPWVRPVHFCGGVVIAPTWVLTAGHCVRAVPWYATAVVVAGKTNLGDEEPAGVRAKVNKYITHEKYDPGKNGGVGPNDIGLLRLKKALTYSDAIRPAKLPVAGAIPSGWARLTGWGSMSQSEVLVTPLQLQYLELPVIPFEECHAFVQNASDAQGAANPLVDTNVCVGYLNESGQGACKGDSGGPLVQPDDGDLGNGTTVVVIGITSWGYFPCAAEPAPSVYTRVSAFVDWIVAKTGPISSMPAPPQQQPPNPGPPQQEGSSSEVQEQEDAAEERPPQSSQDGPLESQDKDDQPVFTPATTSPRAGQFDVGSQRG